MNIEKSTRHQHIIGKFGEYLLCNWLSRTGFEVSLVDHTGLDVVAYNPKTELRMGITVKSRTRNVGTERTQVNIFSYRQGKDDRKRLLDACTAFASEPWIAVYVETLYYAELYLTSLTNYDEKYRVSEGRTLDTWKMSPKYKELYERDSNVKYVRADFHQEGWAW
jgi:hypothetical protein